MLLRLDSLELVIVKICWTREGINLTQIRFTEEIIFPYIKEKAIVGR